MKLKDIKESLDENIEFLKREIKRGAPIGELRHLTGRIGELYVANKYNGEMPASVNQAGYDVKAKDGKRISVKTTTSDKGSHQFFFNKNTLDKVDQVVILRISSEAEISILFDGNVNDARKLMVERGKYAISQSKLSNLEKYLLEESNVEIEYIHTENIELASMDYYDFKVIDTEYRMFKNKNIIRIQKDESLVKSVKPELRNICEALNIPVKYSGSGKDSTINKTYANRIIKNLSLKNLNKE